MFTISCVLSDNKINNKLDKIRGKLLYLHLLNTCRMATLAKWLASGGLTAIHVHNWLTKSTILSSTQIVSSKASKFCRTVPNRRLSRRNFTLMKDCTFKISQLCFLWLRSQLSNFTSIQLNKRGKYKMRWNISNV